MYRLYYRLTADSSLQSTYGAMASSIAGPLCSVLTGASSPTLRCAPARVTLILLWAIHRVCLLSLHPSQNRKPSLAGTSFNPLTPNDHYSRRTAPLTSKHCILYIYSTNTGTEYFKRGIYSPFFFSSSKCSLFHNSNIFGSCFIHILYTGCAKIKKIIPASKG